MSIQDIKFLIAWGSTTTGLPPSSALPVVLSLLESTPACTDTVLHALQTFLLGALGKIFLVSTPKQAHRGNKDNDVNSLNDAVRVISVHLLGVLQKNSVQWAPIISKWIVDILRLAEPTLPTDSPPSLELLLASRLKHPALKHLSSLLSSSWLFLSPASCSAILYDLLQGSTSTEAKKGSQHGSELDWVLAMVGVQDPEKALQAALSHLANTYATLDPRQQPAQQLAISRAGKLVEFLSFRFPVHASSSVLLYLDDGLSSTSPKPRTMEEKIGFLSAVGTALPKLFDAAFGVVLDRAESSADLHSTTWRLTHNHTRALVESFLTERMQNISASSYLPRIFSLLHSVSSDGVQAMDDGNGTPLHSLAHSLLSHILNTLCDISFNSTSKSNDPILWGVAGQWPIFWDLGEIGQALVLTAISGLDKGNQSSSAHNVHAVAGAVLAHALVKTDLKSSSADPYPTLLAVLSVFNSQPSLLARALDCVMEQIAPNPNLCSVVLGRLDDLIPYCATPPFSTVALNVSMHWEKILTFASHPHLPLRLTSLRLLRSLIPVLYSQVPTHYPPGAVSNLPPQHASQIAKLSEKATANSSQMFHPKSIRKLKMDVVSTQTIYRTLLTAFLSNLGQHTIDFEFVESLMNTIAATTSLSVLHFGQLVTLLLEFIFSDKCTDILREYTSTPLIPMNSLPQAPSSNNNEAKGLLEMNYTRHWRAQIHNRLGSGVFIPKRQRLSDSDFPHSTSAIPVRDNNIHNDMDYDGYANGHTNKDSDLDLYGNDKLAMRRGIVVSLFGRCVASQPPAYFSTLSDQLLVNLTTQAPLPTYEQYADVLPKISPFERDIFLRKVFKQNPILLDILEIIADAPLEMIKLFEIIKGLLANTIAQWHADPGSSTTKNSYYNFTVRFINILGKAQWIPHPLSCCGEIMGVMTPSELSMLLITMWNFVRDFPPTLESYSISKSGKPKRIFTSQAKLNLFIRPMRTIVHAHIVELGALYRAYFEPRE